MPTSPARSALRWLAPSVVTALAGAVGAGIVEALPVRGWVATVAITGFVALVAMPLLLVTSLVVRGALAAWQPRALLARLVDADGGAPRFAAWIAVLWLALVGLGWAVFQGTWLLAAWTAFKPLPISFAEPLLAIAALALVVALSLPAARVLTALFRRLDRSRRLSGQPSLFGVWPVLGITALVTLDLGYAAWLWLVRPKLRPSFDGFAAPVTALGVMIAAQLAWTWLPRTRRYVSALTAALGALAIGAALVVRLGNPNLALEIWAHRPLAGRALEILFDVDAIRESVSPDEFRPIALAGHPGHPGASHPDLVLITIDTTRADHTPPYGGQADMPVLREIATRGAVFEWAFAPSNDTRKSFLSIALGLAPNRVHGRFEDWAPHLDPRHVVVAERLRAGGYETAGFMCCRGLWAPELRTGLARGLEHLEVEPDGIQLARSARAWLESREADHEPGRPPLFLWLHLLEPHDWIVGAPEPRTDGERHRLYDHALAATDILIGEVLGVFAQRAPAAAPIVIVTSDHGEGLGEHGQLAHGTDLYNSQLRVPLVIMGPGIRPQRIAEVVSLVDLVPTLVELAGFEPAHGRAIDGRSLVDLATGKRTSDLPQGRAFAVAATEKLTALVRGNWKLIDNAGSLELYDILTDPGEHNNVAAKNPQLVQQMRAMHDDRIEAEKRSPF